MPIYSFSINVSPQEPDIATGYVRAPDARKAIEIVGDSRVNVYPLHSDVLWPYAGRNAVYFER